MLPSPVVYTSPCLADVYFAARHRNLINHPRGAQNIPGDVAGWALGFLFITLHYARRQTGELAHG